MLHSSSSGITMTRSTRLAVSPPVNDKSSELVNVSASEPNRARGINSLLPENETTTSLLTSTEKHESKTRCGESQTPVA